MDEHDTDVAERVRSGLDGLVVPERRPERAMARGRSRRRAARADVAAVALVLGLAIVLPLVGLGRLIRGGTEPAATRTTPPATTTSSPSPLERPPFRHAKFVAQRVIASGPTTLVMEAPPGLVRWRLAGCNVTGTAVGASKRSGGFGSGSCNGGDPRLSAGIGGLSVAGTFYDVISGRTIPSLGVDIRVRFHDGAVADVTPVHGLWMVVFRPVPTNYSPGSQMDVVEAIAPDGHVLARVEIRG